MLTVADLMTDNPIIIDIIQSLAEAAQRMKQFNVRHLPVIDRGRLAGVLSERDIYRFQVEKPGVSTEVISVGEAMAPDPYVVRPDAPVREVALAMAHQLIGAAVVMDGDRLAGVFTTTDALRALASASPPDIRVPALRLKKILCPIDFSPGSREAVALAIDLARASGGSVTLFHAFEQPIGGLAEAVVVESETLAQIDKRVEAELHAWKAEHETRGGPPIASAKGIGQPANAIARHAADHGYDLIVIGTHGRTGVKRVLLGSVAENVARHASCPVLVVRRHDGATQALRAAH
jgi:acetoin utilization protein AcuB